MNFGVRNIIRSVTERTKNVIITRYGITNNILYSDNVFKFQYYIIIIVNNI